MTSSAELTKAYLGTPEAVSKLAALRDSAYDEIRSKYAKLNELTEHQEQTVKQAMLDSLEQGLNFGLDTGFAKGMDVQRFLSNSKMSTILVSRTFFASLLMVPISISMMSLVANPVLAVLVSSTIVTTMFYVVDKVADIAMIKLLNWLASKNQAKAKPQ